MPPPAWNQRTPLAADKSTNRNRLVQRAVQSDETDAAAVGSTVVRFQLADELHGAYLGGAAQGTGREGVVEGLDGARPLRGTFR